MAHRIHEGQRGIKPPSRHGPSGGEFEDRERGPPSAEAPAAAPIQTPFLPLCVATRLLGDQLLRPSLLVTSDPVISLLAGRCGSVAECSGSGLWGQSQTEPQPPTHALRSSGPTIKPFEPSIPHLDMQVMALPTQGAVGKTQWDDVHEDVPTVLPGDISSCHHEQVSLPPASPPPNPSSTCVPEWTQIKHMPGHVTGQLKSPQWKNGISQGTF